MKSDLPNENLHPNKPASDEQWSLVAQRRRRYNTAIKGEKKVDDKYNLQGVPRFSYLHVFRLNPITTTDILKKYLKPQFSEVTVHKMDSKHPEEYSSFKIGVFEENIVKALSPAIWPSGVCVNKFYASRNNDKISRNNTNFRSAALDGMST